MAEKDKKIVEKKPQATFFNPVLFNKNLFPVNLGERVSNAFQRGVDTIGGFSGGKAPMMAAGAAIPSSATLSDFRFTGPLLGSGPMFGVRGAQQAAPQPARQPYNYGLFAATAGLPSFDVTKTQTPSSQTQIGTDLLTGKTSQLQFEAPTQNAITYNKAPEERMAVATPYGNISATFQSGNSGARQLENLNARTTSYVGRTPAEQQALLAQVRQNGSQMAGAQDQFFAQKRAERSGLAQAEATARAVGASSMDIMRARDIAAGPSTLASIRGQSTNYQQRLPMEGLASRGVSDFSRNLRISQPVITNLGPSGFALYEQQQAAKRSARKTI